MNKTISLGIFQYDILWEDINGNLSYIEDFLGGLSSFPNLLILPEMFSTGFSMHPERLTVEKINFQKEWLLRVSKNSNMHIIGSIVDFDNKNYYNRMLLVNPDGSFFQYDKRHLFRMGKENDIYIKGNNRQVFSLDGVKIFPQICYDLRFPVWSRNTEGYHILINVANWPASRQVVWNTLLRARAIENQCFAVGVNRIGNDENGMDYAGGSVVYDAQGDEMIKLDNKALFKTVTLNITELINFKEKFPVYMDADLFELKVNSKK